jgi:hypothetical protein
MSTGHGSNVPSKLTSDELIRLELRGKLLAIERYDSMLWKIRSGYVVVLYGSLTIVMQCSLLLSYLYGPLACRDGRSTSSFSERNCE